MAHLSLSVKSGGDSEGDPLRQVATNSRFWLMLLGKSCLMMSGQFMTFLPLYFSTGLKLPANQAATNSALFAVPFHMYEYIRQTLFSAASQSCCVMLLIILSHYDMKLYIVLFPSQFGSLLSNLYGTRIYGNLTRKKQVL